MVMYEKLGMLEAADSASSIKIIIKQFIRRII